MPCAWPRVIKLQIQRWSQRERTSINLSKGELLTFNIHTTMTSPRQLEPTASLPLAEDGVPRHCMHRFDRPCSGFIRGIHRVHGRVLIRTLSEKEAFSELARPICSPRPDRPTHIKAGLCCRDHRHSAHAKPLQSRPMLSTIPLRPTRSHSSFALRTRAERASSPGGYRQIPATVPCGADALLEN